MPELWSDIATPVKAQPAIANQSALAGAKPTSNRASTRPRSPQQGRVHMPLKAPPYAQQQPAADHAYPLCRQEPAQL